MKNILFWVLLLLSVQLFFLVNLQFTAWPEMFSYAYLRNHDFLIYRDMIHPYPPLLTMGLSWIYAILGYHLWVLQTAAWIVILASSILVFLVTREITKSDRYSLSALALFVFFQPFLEGNMLWFDLAIVPPLLLGLLFILRKNLLLAGIFLAAAVLIKQTTGLYFVFSILYLVFVQKLEFAKLKLFFVGPMILGVPFLVRLIQEGALSDFINWVLVYPLTKWGSIIGYVRMEMSFKESLVIFLLLLPIIVKVKLFLRDHKLRTIFLFLVCALIAVYPRFSFFHFQTALALIAIMYGYILSKTKVNLRFITLNLLVFVYLVHAPVLFADWQKEPRFYEKNDVQIAQIISSKVGEKERVYLFGLHSGLYVMSNRLPPERWTDNFAWYLEIPRVQDEIIDRWGSNPPEFVVWRTPSAGNPFDLGTYQPAKITEWIESNYNKKEEVKPGIWLWAQQPPPD